MKKFGEGGFLGASFPEEDGGMGLDYSYTVAIAETMGEIRCGAIPMAIGVQVTLSLGILYELYKNLFWSPDFGKKSFWVALEYHFVPTLIYLNSKKKDIWKGKFHRFLM